MNLMNESVSNPDTLESGYSRNEVVELLEEFEREHPVETYFAHGVYVWPLLRNMFGHKLMAFRGQIGNFTGTNITPHRSIILERKGDSNVQRKARTIISIVKYLSRFFSLLWDQRNLKAIQAKDVENNDLLAIDKRDIVIHTTSGRRVMLEGRLYDIYSDPLANLLDTSGVSYIVWERGQERYPRFRPSSWITKRLAWESALGPRIRKMDEPTWFAGFASWVFDVLSDTITWDEIDRSIRGVVRRSYVFEKWLHRTEAKMLICINWYGQAIMPAIMAAHRLGIISVDLQHGIIDDAHFAYAKWLKQPATGFECVPDYFWCWGSRNAKTLADSNPAFQGYSNTLVGGNMWFNQCRDGRNQYISGQMQEIRRMLIGYRKHILVVLQGRKDSHDVILGAIERSSRDWKWSFRFHPAMTEGQRLKVVELYDTVEHPGLDFALANKYLLYSLLSVSDVFITGSSTVALEGLGFGVPGVTINTSGLDLYSEYIQTGVMFYAQYPETLVNCINLAEHVTSEKCRLSVLNQFADAEHSSKAIDALLNSIVIQIPK